MFRLLFILICLSYSCTSLNLISIPPVYRNHAITDDPQNPPLTVSSQASSNQLSMCKGSHLRFTATSSNISVHQTSHHKYALKQEIPIAGAVSIKTTRDCQLLVVLTTVLEVFRMDSVSGQYLSVQNLTGVAAFTSISLSSDGNVLLACDLSQIVIYQLENQLYVNTDVLQMEYTSNWVVGDINEDKERFLAWNYDTLTDIANQGRVVLISNQYGNYEIAATFRFKQCIYIGAVMSSDGRWIAVLHASTDNVYGIMVYMETSKHSYRLVQNIKEPGLTGSDYSSVILLMTRDGRHLYIFYNTKRIAVMELQRNLYVQTHSRLSPYIHYGAHVSEPPAVQGSDIQTSWKIHINIQNVIGGIGYISSSLTECSPNQYSDGTNCLNCTQSNCDLCQSAQVCTRCIDGFEVTNGSCQEIVRKDVRVIILSGIIGLSLVAMILICLFTKKSSAIMDNSHQSSAVMTKQVD